MKTIRYQNVETNLSVTKPNSENNLSIVNKGNLLVTLLIMFFMQGCNKSMDEDNIPTAEVPNLVGWEITKTNLGIDVAPHPCDMYFVNADIGFFVGYWGQIYKTTDAGKSWRMQRSGTTANLLSVFFLDENTGFVSSQTGGYDEDTRCVLLKTIDGGATWEKTSFDDYLAIRCLHFFDRKNGLAIIRLPNISNGKDCVIAKTLDGGANWELTNLNGYTALEKFLCVDDVVFVNGKNQTILKSEDYGNTWESINTPLQSNTGIYELYFLNENVGFVAGKNRDIYRTNDGGLNWKNIDFPFHSFGIFHFYNEMEGFNIASESIYDGGDFPTYKGCRSYQTHDAGATWNKPELINSEHWGITYFVQKDLGYGLNSTDFYTIKRK